MVSTQVMGSIGGSTGYFPPQRDNTADVDELIRGFMHSHEPQCGCAWCEKGGTYLSQRLAHRLQRVSHFPESMMFSSMASTWVSTRVSTRPY